MVEQRARTARPTRIDALVAAVRSLIARRFNDPPFPQDPLERAADDGALPLLDPYAWRTGLASSTGEMQRRGPFARRPPA